MILADENIHSGIIAALRKIPIEVISIKENYSGMIDEEIIKLSISTKKIILTEDKDFGEWVFAHNIKDISVIFLRFHFTEITTIISVLTDLLKNNNNRFYNKFTTITTRKIRSRKI